MAVSSTDKNVATSFFDITVATSFFDITITYDSYALRVKQGLGDIVRAVLILMLVGKYLEVALLWRALCLAFLQVH